MTSLPGNDDMDDPQNTEIARWSGNHVAGQLRGHVSVDIHTPEDGQTCYVSYAQTETAFDTLEDAISHAQGTVVSMASVGFVLARVEL